LRIKNTRPAFRRTGDPVLGVRTKAPAAATGSFERHFNTLGEEQYEEYLSDLTRRIEAQGDRLAQRADMAEMERFRALVAELINEVVSNAFAFQKEKYFDIRGRHKIFATVNRINEKLDELAKEILEGKRDRLEIMSRIDEIRGLVIDILL